MALTVPSRKVVWGEGGLGEVRLLDICKTPKEKSTRT